MRVMTQRLPKVGVNFGASAFADFRMRAAGVSCVHAVTSQTATAPSGSCRSQPTTTAHGGFRALAFVLSAPLIRRSPSASTAGGQVYPRDLRDPPRG